MDEPKVIVMEGRKKLWHTDAEFRSYYLQKMKEYRDKKRQEKIDAGEIVRPRGRPRKDNATTSTYAGKGEASEPVELVATKVQKEGTRKRGRKPKILPVENAI